MRNSGRVGAKARTPPFPLLPSARPHTLYLLLSHLQLPPRGRQDKYSSDQRLVPITVDAVLTTHAPESPVPHCSLLLPTWLSPVCSFRSRQDPASPRNLLWWPRVLQQPHLPHIPHLKESMLQESQKYPAPLCVPA